MNSKIHKEKMFVFVGKDRANNNKPFVNICTPDYIPVSPWVSNYLTIHLSGTKFNSKNQYAKELKLVLEYFNSKNIDIEERVYSGRFFEMAELEAFFNFCKYKSESGLSNVVDINSDSSIEIAMHAGKVATGLAKAGTAKSKIKQFRDFLSFLFMYIHADNLVPADVRYRYELAKEFLTKECPGRLKDFESECVGEAESPLPTNAFINLMDMIKVDSPENPFKRSKFRNYLMINLYIETGNRRGDHASLKISDMKFEGTFDEIAIVKRPNDPSDSRKFQPATKTDSHLSQVPKSLMIDVERYINEVRTLHPKSNQHEFVFITENNSKGTIGEPLSLSSIDKIFEKISKVIGYKIHCHLLRYKFNEIMTEIAEEQGLSDVEVEKMRKYMMGWSRDSAMADKYNRYKIHKKAQLFNQLRQDKMTEAGKKIEKTEETK